jgi:hypothetical protein
VLAALARREIAIKRGSSSPKNTRSRRAPHSRDVIGKARDDESGDAGHRDPRAMLRGILA